MNRDRVVVYVSGGSHVFEGDADEVEQIRAMALRCLNGRTPSMTVINSGGSLFVAARDVRGVE